MLKSGKVRVAAAIKGKISQGRQKIRSNMLGVMQAGRQVQ